MKLFCLGALLLGFSLTSNGQGDWLNAYQRVCEDWKNPESAEVYLNFVRKSDASALSPCEVVGFHAAAEMIHANHGWNVIDQWMTFTQWRDSIEWAISKEPHSPELRLIRFGIQDNAPGFLGYNKDLKEDREFCQTALERGDWKAYPGFEQFVEQTISESP